MMGLSSSQSFGRWRVNFPYEVRMPRRLRYSPDMYWENLFTYPSHSAVLYGQSIVHKKISFLA